MQNNKFDTKTLEFDLHHHNQLQTNIGSVKNASQNSSMVSIAKPKKSTNS